MNIYWAYLCILNRMEGEKMEAAGKAWAGEENTPPRMVYLGDTEEVGMYEKVASDSAGGIIGFDLLVSSRFDLFCSDRYLKGFRGSLLPLGDHFPLRKEFVEKGIMDGRGLFLPLVVLPHFIVVNSRMVRKGDYPRSLGDLLKPEWEGKVVLGSTELPSAKAVLFAVWYLYGDGGLERCVRNWRQKSAPSAARHGLVKGEFPVAVLPGIFAGPGPGEELIRIVPAEGAPLLPSFAAVNASGDKRAVEFLRENIFTEDLMGLYRDRAFAYPAHPAVEPPDLCDLRETLFPPWEWINSRDMDWFDGKCREVPSL